MITEILLTIVVIVLSSLPLEGAWKRRDLDLFLIPFTNFMGKGYTFWCILFVDIFTLLWIWDVISKDGLRFLFNLG